MGWADLRAAHAAVGSAIHDMMGKRHNTNRRIEIEGLAVEVMGSGGVGDVSLR